MKTKFYMPEKMQTAVNVFTGIMVMVVNLGISFFLSPYIVDTLGEEANGFNQLAHNFVTYASLISIAFNSMASRFISINYHRGNYKKVDQYYTSTMICNMGMILILGPIAGYIVFNLENIINIENVPVNDVKLLFACVFLNFFVGLVSSIYSISMYVKNSWYIHNIIELLRNLLKAFILFIVYAFFPPRVFYSSVVVVGLSSIIILCNKFFCKRLMPELKMKFSDFSFQAVCDMIGAGIWNTINQCGNLLMTGLDLLVTNLFISPSAMGILSIAKTVPTAITGLASTLNSNLSPGLTISVAKGNKEEILRTLRSGMKISSILVTIPYMVFCAYGVEFYSLWMPSLDARMLTKLSFLSCMALVPWAGPQVLNNIFSATNKLKVNTVTFLIAGLINVGVVYILLKYTNIGVVAVAGTSSVISILRCVFVVAPYIAHLLDLKWWTFYKDAGVSVLCCLINYTLSRCIHLIIKSDTWIGLIFAVIVSAGLCLCADSMILLNKKERQYLLSKIRKGK